MKTSELNGVALDWAVAKAIGWNEVKLEKNFISGLAGDASDFSTDWAQGGPLIEEYEIGLKRKAPCSAGREWEASPSITAKGAGGKWGYGPTPLVAAMRCLVASKLGDEVELPEELK